MNKKTLYRYLDALVAGNALPASKLKGEDWQMMMDEGVLVTITHGSRCSYRASSKEMLENFIASHWEITDIHQAYELLSDASEVTRAELVATTGDSKTVSRRTFTGFLVNSYQPIQCTLNDCEIVLMPHEGSFVYIYDYQRFTIHEDVVVVGIENGENFRMIVQQKPLFDSYFGPDTLLLFVSRYPQSKDLVRWLTSIPNRYVHFGDLDLAGVNIYLTEFFKYLPNRASFLVPADYEKRLQQGSRERYDTQYKKYQTMKVLDSRLSVLVNAIHCVRKGYDQEGYIECQF